jgi:hypothetical protein
MSAKLSNQERDKLLEELGVLDAYRSQEGVFESLVRLAFLAARRAARGVRGVRGQDAPAQAAAPTPEECQAIVAEILPYTATWRAICESNLGFHPRPYVDAITESFAGYLIEKYWPKVQSELA